MVTQDKVTRLLFGARIFIFGDLVSNDVSLFFILTQNAPKNFFFKIIRKIEYGPRK